jgi:hypothetical protein
MARLITFELVVEDNFDYLSEDQIQAILDELEEVIAKKGLAIHDQNSYVEEE